MIVTEFRLKLYPKNVSRARTFYEEVLRFPVVHEWNDSEDDRGVMFDVAGTILELLTTDTPESYTGIDISLGVPNVWRLWEELHEDATVIHGLRDNEWGDTSFCIADPDGFEITFFTKTGNRTT